MTRRPKKRRPPERSHPERPLQTSSWVDARRASGAAPQLWKRYGLPAVCGLLLLAVLIVFSQTISHDFIDFDDTAYVCENPYVRGGLTAEGTAWAITTYHCENWHPLTWLSHMLDCQLYGLNSGGHHLTNVLLHAATAVLLFLTLRRMTAAIWPSAWVAAVFAIHPLRVESVAWVAERKDILSGLFFMLTLWFYARYAQRPASWGRYYLVVASFALGLAAKPMLVTLPFVLLLLDYWPLGRLSQRFAPRTLLVRLVVEKIPLFLLAAASCLITLAAQRTAIRSWEELGVAGRVANVAVAYLAYLGKMLYPAGLVIFYPIAKDPPPVWEVVAAMTTLLAVSAAVFAARRKCPYLLFGWLWYLGTLVPVIGLVQVGFHAMADRYTYLTQIGLYTAFAWGAAEVAGFWPRCRWPLRGVSALVLAGLMVCAWQQTRHWRDSEALWTHTLACNSQNPLAHSNLGNALVGRGQVDEAIAHYRQALEIKPDDVMTHTNLGVALAGRGQLDEAIAHHRTALTIKPDLAEAHNNLAIALAARGQIDEAIVHYRRALEIMPNYAVAHNNLGFVLAGRGQLDEAITHFRKAVEIKPDYAKAYISLGDALASRGRRQEAIENFQKALDLASAGRDKALADAVRARIKRSR